MTRLVSADEARGLMEGATRGPWRVQIAACGHEDVAEHAAIKGGGFLVVVCVDEKDAEIIAAAPDLAATVIALSEELAAAESLALSWSTLAATMSNERDRLRAILACERGERAPEGWRWTGTFWMSGQDRVRVASIGGGYAHTAGGQWCAERFTYALEAIEAADRAATPK